MTRTETAENILHVVDGGALTRQRVHSVETTIRRERPASRWIDWAAMGLLGLSAGAACAWQLAYAVMH